MPGQSGARHFNGKEVTKIVHSWEKFGEKYSMDMYKIVTELVEDCSPSVNGYGKTLIEIVNRNHRRNGTERNGYRTIEQTRGTKMLLKKFSMDDTQQQRDTVPYLLM